MIKLVRVAWARGREALHRITAHALEAARNPRRLLLLVSVVALIAFGVPLTIAGAGRIVHGVGDWRRDAGADWHRARGRIVAVRDDPGALAVRVRYRDESGVAHVVPVGLDGRTGRWLGPHVRLRYDTNDHSEVDLRVDGMARPGIDLLLAGAPLGAGLAGIAMAFALWRRRRTVIASERPVVAACSASVVGIALLFAGLTAWSIGTVAERGWSGVGASMSDAVATVFAEFLGVLIPIVTFVIGCVMTAWLRATGAASARPAHWPGPTIWCTEPPRSRPPPTSCDRSTRRPPRRNPLSPVEREDVSVARS